MFLGLGSVTLSTTTRVYYLGFRGMLIFLPRQEYGFGGLGVCARICFLGAGSLCPFGFQPERDHAFWGLCRFLATI